jgi:hypothetical protein
VDEDWVDNDEAAMVEGGGNPNQVSKGVFFFE